MVRYSAVLLAENRLGESTFFNNRLVVEHDPRWAINRIEAKPQINSVAIFNAMNSESNVEVSRLFYLFDYQQIGARFANISTPV